MLPFLLACEENKEVGNCLQTATSANNEGKRPFADVSRSKILLLESQLSHKHFGYAKSQPEIAVFGEACVSLQPLMLIMV